MKPLSKEEVLEKVNSGQSLEGAEIGDVDFSNHTFAAYVSFSGATFTGEANFSEAEFAGYVGFNEATFTGEANFSESEFAGYANFSGATFTGEANFSEAEFAIAGDADFSRAFFKGEASFNQTKFMGNALFALGVFENEPMDEAEFARDAHFDGATFAGEARFSGATFTGNVNFFEATFTGEANFYEATFTGDAYFSGARFTGEANFRGANFEGKTFFQGTEHNSVFSLEHETNFRNVIFKDPKKIKFTSVSFERCLIVNLLTDLSKIGFYDVKWPVKDKKRIVYDDNVSKPNYEYLKKTYSELVKNYEDKRSFDEAEDFYYREMEMKRLSKSKPFQFISLLSFYKYLSSYGQSVIRTILVLCFFVIMMFPLLYMHSGIINKELIERIEYKFPEDFASITSQKFWRDYKGSITHSLEVSTLKRETLYKSNTEFGHALESFQIILVSIQVALCIIAIRRSFRR